MAAQTKAAVVGANFGDPSMYAAGAFVENGDYILFFNVMMHQAQDKTTGAAKGPNLLGVMIDFYPKDNPTEDAKKQKFYSMGSKAHESFAPNAETGKGIVPIPGAKGQSLNDKTNWAIFHASLYNTGLQPGIFTNDISVLDGLWAHIENQDEPSERGSFQSNTAEVAAAPRTPGKIPVVTEFLEGGMPWEGGGGLEAAPAKPAAKTQPKATPKAAPKAAPVAAAAEGPDEADVRGAAISVISDLIEKKPNGMPRVALKTETFKLAKTKFDETMAASIASSFLENLDAFGDLLGELGYKFGGAGNAQVVPA